MSVKTLLGYLLRTTHKGQKMQRPYMVLTKLITCVTIRWVVWILLKTKQHNSIKTNGKLHKIIFICSKYQHTHKSVSFIHPHSNFPGLVTCIQVTGNRGTARVEQLVGHPTQQSPSVSKICILKLKKKNDFLSQQFFLLLRQIKVNSKNDFFTVHNFCQGLQLLMVTPGVKKPSYTTVTNW